MSKKTFLIYKVITAILLAMTVSISVNSGNYIFPAVAVVAAVSFLYGVKTKVKEVLADERDYKVAGQAARLSLTVYSILMVAIGFIALSLKKVHPEFEYLSYTLLYSVCALMILNAVLFKIYSRYGD